MNDQIAITVIRVLEENFFDEEANNLKRLLDQLHSDSVIDRRDASNEICGLCQVRAYGDLNIQTMNGWKWNDLLSKLKACAQKYK